MKRPEDILQEQIVQYLDLQYPKALYCATLGGLRLTIGQAMKIKRIGYRNGIPDIMIYNKSSKMAGLAIEVKSGKGKASEHQKTWFRRLVDNGWGVICVYSFEEAKDFIDEYFKDIL